MDQCLQLFGGWGYMWEYPIARAFVDARVGRIGGGSVEVMKQIISRAMMPDNRKRAVVEASTWENELMRRTVRCGACEFSTSRRSCSDRWPRNISATWAPKSSRSSRRKAT